VAVVKKDKLVVFTGAGASAEKASFLTTDAQKVIDYHRFLRTTSEMRGVNKSSPK